ATLVATNESNGDGCLTAILLYCAAYLMICDGGDLAKFGLPHRFSYLPYRCGIFGDPPGIREGSAQFYVLHGCDFALIGFFYPIWGIDHYLVGGPRFVYR